MTVPAAVLRTLAGLAGLSAMACVSATRGGEPPLPAQFAHLSPEFRHDRIAPAASSRSVIGTDILYSDPTRSVYDIVARQWPVMLRPAPVSLRGNTDPYGDIIGVYAKGMWLGGQETLRSVPAGQVLAIYRLSMTEEFARFGRRHDGGAVEIVWKR